MFEYFKKSWARKKARRITREYPAEVVSFELPVEGKVEFANWKNPLVWERIINQEMMDFYGKFIKKDSFVIDIGANIGDTTVPMALVAGNTGLTLAFEPNPLIFKILQVNSKLNKEKTNIIPLPFAIADSEEEFFYISSEASFSNGGISKEISKKHGKFVYKEKVKAIMLEDYLKKNYSEWLSKLSFIKIDTEGYDKEIIKTISNLIKTFKPVIVAECFGPNSNEEKIELYEILDKMGYEIYYFYDFDKRAEVAKINSSQEMIKRKSTFNLYAIPKL